MRNLEKALFEKKISDKALSTLLNVTEKTLNNKMNGTTDFTMSEVWKIKELFPEYDMMYLFARDGNLKPTG